MLLTITCFGKDAANLSYLLYKNPYRPQEFELSFGKAYVFYPCLSDEKTTAALLLDIDPVDLARGKAGSAGGGLFDYVNDRPYVSSSFLSVAISGVFRTAMTGRADEYQAISDSPLELEAFISMLPCRGELGMINRIFEPLGYVVNYETFDMDEKFTDWGKSKYINLTIKGKVRLRDMLKHLYVLIPVFDRQKHYWVGEDEVEKLLRNSDEWLPNHPEKGYITSRYLKKLRPLVNKAFEQLVTADEQETEEEAEQGAETAEAAEKTERRLKLNDMRLGSVIAALKSCNAKSVIDIGCGEGNLLRLLVKEKQFTRIAGTDVSHVSLKRAADKLKLDRDNNILQEKLTLFQSSLTYKDSRFAGYDAACVIEVIEHLDLPRLSAFEKVLFGAAKPPVIRLTTPNREYNAKYENVGEDGLRHSDHRFEWTRAEFHDWAEITAAKYGYTVKFSEIGEADETLGAATQMGVFS
jgi:3' terminal RNA ribose 2'-O-methyltransferase Hen1